MAANSENSQAIVLPLGVVTKNDLGRLLREVESVEDFLHQASIRKPGSGLNLPKTSQLLEELLSLNQLNLLQTDHRQKALTELRKLHGQALVLSISFAVDPSTIFLQKLITWLRQHIHPQILLQIGLQPNQGAGCIVRTTNKFFDFSLRRRFADSKDLLLKAISQDESNVQKQEVAT